MDQSIKAQIVREAATLICHRNAFRGHAQKLQVYSCNAIDAVFKNTVESEQGRDMSAKDEQELLALLNDYADFIMLEYFVKEYKAYHENINGGKGYEKCIQMHWVRAGFFGAHFSNKADVKRRECLLAFADKLMKE